jgi:UPF0271 protein
MKCIDINCDMGEGMLNDEAIMPFISSANIACGYHAGNSDIMKQTVNLALQYNIAIGAHPGFNDKENFGRKNHILSTTEYYDIFTDQIYTLQSITSQMGAKLHHIKPHGALYNMAATNVDIANILAQAIKDIDDSLILYGLCNSYLISAAKSVNIKTASEVFADRYYGDDGNLIPRTHTDSLIEDPNKSLEQIVNALINGYIKTLNGKKLPIYAETLCVHGDNKNILVFLEKITIGLVGYGIKIKRFDVS